MERCNFEEAKVRIKVQGLTEENLVQAPEWRTHPYSCKYCVYWEHPDLCVDPETEVKEEIFEKKLEWLRRVKAEWRNCGKLLIVVDKVVGYAQYAPVHFLPNAKEIPRRTGK
jgi:hypothetical protein